MVGDFGGIRVPVLGGGHHLDFIGMAGKHAGTGVTTSNSTDVGIGRGVAQPLFATGATHIGVACATVEVGMASLTPSGTIGTIRQGLVEVHVGDVVMICATG